MDEGLQDAASLIEPRWQHLGENKTREVVAKVDEILASKELSETSSEADAGEQRPLDREIVEKVKQHLASERVKITGGR